MDKAQADALRAPFPPEQIGSKKGGGRRPDLDYVGHAAVTDRLLQVDPEWYWTPDRREDGRWDVQTFGNEAVLTGTLTICGVTRACVGIHPLDDNEVVKKLQSDAIRNGAMRFGVALDLWSKEDLHTEPAKATKKATKKEADPPPGLSPNPDDEPWASLDESFEFPTKAGAMHYLVDCMEQHGEGLETAKKVWAGIEDMDAWCAGDVHMAVAAWKQGVLG